MDEEPRQSRPHRRDHQGRIGFRQGSQRPLGFLYRAGGRGIAEAAAGRSDRSLSVALAGPVGALRGNARRLSEADRQGQDPPCRRLQSRCRAIARGARRRQPAVAAALRGAAAGVQSLRPFLVRRPACRPVHCRGNRRHHLFQPRQGVPERQVPQQGRSRQKPARRWRRQLSRRSRFSHPGGTRRRCLAQFRAGRPRWRSPG